MTPTARKGDDVNERVRRDGLEADRHCGRIAKSEEHRRTEDGRRKEWAAREGVDAEEPHGDGAGAYQAGNEAFSYDTLRLMHRFLYMASPRFHKYDDMREGSRTLF